ncbi:MAG TPA: DUF2231 domain-containing protein [Vicinamibacterales bacterium]|nr:DUF2231 domain-containing protein [Vicinamibacterales bacterium]
MIPSLAALHPQVVHFTIVLVIVGAVFRVISLFGRPKWISPAATTLLVLAAVAGYVSSQSGTAAHGPIERIPGVRPAVQEHEEWGERARNALLILGVIELAALAMWKSPRVKLVHGVAAIGALVCVGIVYEAGEHGGTLVYSYAGGPGLRTGDPKDTERLLLAGYYNQAMADRKAGRLDSAAQLIKDAATRYNSDPEVRLLAAESQLLDQKNAQGAIDALAAFEPPPQLRIRKAMLQADAFEALGQKDAAIAVLQAIVSTTPNARVQQRLDKLQGKTPAS